MTSTAPNTHSAQYLGFYVGDEQYAVGVLRVREILEYGVLTRVPKAPASIRGVINLRGRVVPIVDLAVKLGLSPSTITKRTCIIVVELELLGEPTVMGLLADAVSQVMDLPSSEIEPPPSFGTRVQAEGLVGMGRFHGKLVQLLDLDQILTADEPGVSPVPEPPASAQASPQL